MHRIHMCSFYLSFFFSQKTRTAWHPLHTVVTSGMKGKQHLKEDSPSVRGTRVWRFEGFDYTKFRDRVRECVHACVKGIRKRLAQGLSFFFSFFNSAFKEEITSNKRDCDCDLHCSRSLMKQDEHSPPEGAAKKPLKTERSEEPFLFFSFFLQIMILIYALQCRE